MVKNHSEKEHDIFKYINYLRHSSLSNQKHKKSIRPLVRLKRGGFMVRKKKKSQSKYLHIVYKHNAIGVYFTEQTAPADCVLGPVFNKNCVAGDPNSHML